MLELSFNERRQKDLEKLKILVNKNPELFERRLFNEDDELLKSVGISIPGKVEMPKVLLKVFPSDFIVEEVTPDGRVCTATGESDGFENDQNGNFIHATVVKCGMSTYDVVVELGRILKCEPSKIQYAGIKDKWAITSQRISIPTDVLEKSQIKLETITHEQFFIKDVVKGKGIVQPGLLKGNRFTILLRNDRVSEREKLKTEEGFNSWAKNGMSNFFYLQRFRAPRYTNFHWGFLILDGNYEAAVKLYLTEITGREMAYFESLRNEAKNNFDNPQKLKEIFSQYPSFFETEAQLTSYLADHPKDYIGALKTIETQVQMWIYALTSYYFNKKISSYLAASMPPPKTLPIVLSNDKNDLLPYVEYLEADGLMPPPVKNLWHFRSIQTKHREVPATEKVDLDFVKNIKEGIQLRFTLGKGQYATTYLSHVVTMANDIKRDFEKEIPIVPPEYREVTQIFKEVNNARGVESLLSVDSE